MVGGDGDQRSATLLRGGAIVDGTGEPPRHGDVLIEDGRVVAVGPDAGSGRPDARSVDVEGLAVAPGFIDLHTHCDFTLPRWPRAESMVRQGVTTVVVGNCGHSTFPVGDGERREMLLSYSSFLAGDLDWSWRDASGFREVLEDLPLVPNVALQVGHGSARVAAMGFEARAPSDDELGVMRRAVDEAMDAGAFGISTGLIYPPGTYATTAEIVELAGVAAAKGGFYSTHMRNEGPALLTSVREAIEVAERAGIPLEISHHKVLGRRNWGLTETSLALIDAARERGLDVSADQYPYEASATTLTALLPTWAVEGGTERMQRRLADPAERARIREEVLEGPRDGRPKRDFEPETVMLASVEGGDTQLVGKTLAELADRDGVPAVDAMLELLARHGGGVEVVIFAIGEDDIRRVMSHRSVAVASDGWTLHPDAGGCPHPRSYGTFARVLGRYVREERHLSLPEAVRKMTVLPATRLGLTDRGVVAPGACADLVVFDPETVNDRATFAAPHQYAAGVAHVFVNGAHVIDSGEDTGASTGLVLWRPGARGAA